MEPRYKVWDTETGNLIGEFSTEDEALALVRDTIDFRGWDAAATLVMGYAERGDLASPHLEGTALINRALTSTAHR